jgi:hypothetical protein
MGDFLYICFMERKDYYIYIHYRLDNGKPFYVGYGRGNKTRSRDKKGRSARWKEVLKEAGGRTIKIVHDNLTIDEVSELEIKLILEFGREDLGTGILVNKDPGGKKKSRYTLEEKCYILIDKGFRYDSETGKIYGPKQTEITRKHKQGYISIAVGDNVGNVLGQLFAWFYHYGVCPDGIVDHDNEIKTDNRIVNLILTDHSGNCRNKKSIKGYYFNKKRNKYQAQVSVYGKAIYIGSYDNEIDARNAYLNYVEKNLKRGTNHGLSEVKRTHKPPKVTACSYHKRDNVWGLSISKDSKRIYITTCDTEQEGNLLSDLIDIWHYENKHLNYDEFKTEVLKFRKKRKVKGTKVFDTINNLIYDSAEQAASTIGITGHNLRKMLRGELTNRTNFIYC